MSLPLVPIWGGILDSVHLQLPDGITNWLTAVWVLGLGAILGLLGCAALWGIGNLLSRLPVVGELDQKPTARRITIGVLTVLFLVPLFIWVQNTGNQNVSNAKSNVAAQGSEKSNPESENVQLSAQAGSLVLCAAISWLAAMASVALFTRRVNQEVPLAIREGVLWPLFITASVFATFGVLGITVARKPDLLISSLLRYPSLVASSSVPRIYSLAGATADSTEGAGVPLEVSFYKDEIQEIRFKSDQRVKVSVHPFVVGQPTAMVSTVFSIPPGGETVWVRPADNLLPFVDDKVTQFYARNYSNSPAKLEIVFHSHLAHPEMLTVFPLAIFIVGVFLLYLVQRTTLPKLSAVALATTKSEIAQPLFLISMALGCFALIAFVYIPYNTFGEDIKMLKDTGMSLILVLAIIQAVWASSSSVAEEIDGKTALTVLSKPVSRRDFILGKFVGIAWAVGLMCVIFGLLFLVMVAYKPVYDSREASLDQPTWQSCYREMMLTVPGLILAFMEAVVMAALSVAISTRLPMLANFIISFSIYVLGHLTPLLVQSQVVAENVPQPVVFLAKMSATVLPVLDHFNIQASIAAGASVPSNYMVWAFIYCLLYSSVAMLLALTLFEDRDLA